MMDGSPSLARLAGRREHTIDTLTFTRIITPTHTYAHLHTHSHWLCLLLHGPFIDSFCIVIYWQCRSSDRNVRRVDTREKTREVDREGCSMDILEGSTRSRPREHVDDASLNV